MKTLDEQIESVQRENEMVTNLRRMIGGINVDDAPCCDNLAIALCYYFEAHMDRPDPDPETEHGWGEWAEAKANAALDLIVKDICAAVARRN